MYTFSDLREGPRLEKAQKMLAQSGEYLYTFAQKVGNGLQWEVKSQQRRKVYKVTIEPAKPSMKQRGVSIFFNYHTLC